MSPASETRERIAQRGALLVSLLRREERGLRSRILLWGGLQVAAVAALVLLVCVGIGGLTPSLPRGVGWLIASIAWAAIGFTAWRAWIRPLVAIPNLSVFARLVEERRDFRDMLRAALEWSSRGAPQGESAELVAVTIDRAYDEARALHLTQLFEFPNRGRHALATSIAVAMVALLAFLSPGAPGRALHGLAFRWPTPDDILYGPLEVLSGDPSVLAGQGVDVVVREHGPRAPELLLRYNDTGDLWKSRPLEPHATSAKPSGEAPDIEPPPLDDAQTAVARDYVFHFDDIRNDIVYRFESRRRKTDDHRIRVIQRPIVSRLQLRIVPPAYTGRPAAVLEEGRGDAMALIGSQVEIDATASSSLKSARLVPEDAVASALTLRAPLPMQTTGPAFGARFQLRGDLRYHFDLVDSLGNPNAEPVSYQISSVEDRAPWVEIRDPGHDSDLPKSLQLPLVIYAADDFGIARLTLVYRHERDGEDLGTVWQRRNLPLRGAGNTDAEGRPLGSGPLPELVQNFAWSLDDLGLYPGDYVSYYVEAEDNDDFSGHKTARTPTYRLRLQTVQELYAEIHKGDENRRSQLDEALEKGRQLQEKYEKLARELKKDPEVDWQKQKEIQGALEKQKQLSEQVQKMAEDLHKEVQKMQDQQAVSQEIAQKLDEIRKLMEQVDNEALRQYMERLQQAMKQISPEELQKAMEKMQLSQEDFLKRLERTKSLLEQLRREQQLDQMVERVAELLQQQERLGERTDAMKEKGGPKSDADKKESDQQAEEQQQLGGKTDELQKELEKLSKEAQDAGQPQLQEPNQQLQQENPSGEMQEASKELQQRQPSGAQPHQKQAEKSLRSLYQQLMEAQSMMSMSAQAEASAKMQEAARQLLDVSMRQEDVSRSATQSEGNGQDDLAQQQQALVSATSKVAQDLDSLAQKSLAAPPQVTANVGQAMNRMQEGVRAFERGNSGVGRAQGEEAYGLLNRAIIDLSRSSSSSCNKPGTGQCQQQMDGLMGRQQRLNDMSRQLKDRLRNPDNPTPEERAEMSRLLGEQQAIQQQLDDVERQARETRELLGRLDKMQEEMKEVVQDMQSEQITDETLSLQEHIVSRMLDAQRSLHKRDFNEERESRTGADIFSKGGSKIPESDRMKQLRRDIDRALRSGTPEEYEELVREYFRAISEADGATPQPAPPTPVP